jgi:hypothetical protein
MMALVLSAAGIHTAAAAGPPRRCTGCARVLLTKLSETEMFRDGVLRYLDKGAARCSTPTRAIPTPSAVGGDGTAVRLEATAMPLGLGTWGPIAQATVPWDVSTICSASSPMDWPMPRTQRTSASASPGFSSGSGRYAIIRWRNRVRGHGRSRRPFQEPRRRQNLPRIAILKT